jgi:hypothetical protein
VLLLRLDSPSVWKRGGADDDTRSDVQLFFYFAGALLVDFVGGMPWTKFVQNVSACECWLTHIAH